jgi:hypothetical protein
MYWAWGHSVKPQGDSVVTTIIRVPGTIILAYELAVGGVETLRLSTSQQRSSDHGLIGPDCRCLPAVNHLRALSLHGWRYCAMPQMESS